MSNSLKGLGLSLVDLQAIAKVRDIKGYESMSEGELLSVITPSKKAKIEKIRKEFNESRYKFSKSKIKEIRENLYKIENEKNLSESKIKETEKILLN